MTPNNPPHACESCGSQVEFPGLIYCARCQRSKARRQAEVQAAADASTRRFPVPVFVALEGKARSVLSVSPEELEASLMLALDDLRRKHPELAHSDQLAVRKFADAMEAKMAVSRGRGRSGWNDPAECTIEDLQTGLALHLPKGDPVDVANFCMMLWNRGEKVVTL
jgi:hypothetical protein